MSTVKIAKSEFFGSLDAIPSKSDAHRAIICALLSRKKCTISPIIMSNDISATIGAIQALGAVCEVNGSVLNVDASVPLNDYAEINCRESGSTLRFMLPVVAALGITTKFIGEGRLPDRPIGEYKTLFKEHGAEMSEEKLPLTVSGKLNAGEYLISGNVSSQYITGLILALSCLDKSSEIKLTTELQSANYVDMTIDTLSKFGGNVQRIGNTFKINPTELNGIDYNVEGDWSQASYFIAAGLLGGEVQVKNLTLSSKQADKRFFGIVKQFGGDIELSNRVVTARKSKLYGTEIDAAQFPDIVPTIAVLALFAEGDTVIYNAARLRIKESDRIKTVCDAINALGGEVIEYDDGMKIKPVHLTGGTVDSANDHRIAMAFAVAGAICGDVTIEDASCVNKSYPSFFEDIEKIGGVCDVIDR